MKNKPLVLIMFLLFVLNQQINGQNVKDVLFLGNSYTYYNDLPGLISQLASSAGNKLNYDSNTAGGYKLEEHASDDESIQKIYQQKWDHVILQEQSTRPINNFEAFDNGVRLLNNEIRKNEPRFNTTILYMTWGRQNSEKYPYYEMQAGITVAYDSIANKYSTEVSPVGVAWKKVRDDGDPVNLYNADGTHPSFAGSYLAACIFYAVIFQESPVGLSFKGNISSATAEYLQKYALDAYEEYVNKGLIVTSVSGIVENTIPQLFVFPNPSNQSNPSLNLSSKYPLKVVGLYNSHGVKVLEKEGADCLMELKIHDVKGGIYFLKIEANNNTITRKIIVQN